MTPITLGAYAFCVLVAIGAAGLVCLGFYIAGLFFMGAFKAWTLTPVDDRPRRK